MAKGGGYMALLNIRQEGDPLLRKKSKIVKKFDNKLAVLLDDMLETMDSVNGLGIAAPQVGVLKRAFIIRKDGVTYEIVNPVLAESRGSQTQVEGCLSVYGLQGTVERPEYVRMEGKDRRGDDVVYEAEGYLACAFCHEYDHLDGVLFIDKALETHDTPEAQDEDEDGGGPELSASQAESYAFDKKEGGFS
jgi:peptide deformylase